MNNRYLYWKMLVLTDTSLGSAGIELDYLMYSVFCLVTLHQFQTLNHHSCKLYSARGGHNVAHTSCMKKKKKNWVFYVRKADCEQHFKRFVKKEDSELIETNMS